MFKQKIDRRYVSETDKFLNELNDTLPKSESQQAEIEKHQDIAERRDGKVASKDRRLKNF